MKRIAMWSGPRNISTAMMRAFENRPDTVVVDEPFYAHYLVTTGLAHPGADEVIAQQENDWRVVAHSLQRGTVAGAQVFYQKHMAHHWCGDMDTSWIDGISHAFLLREPRAMLLSLDRVLERVGVSDTGLGQQKILFDELRRRGHTPLVIDARDVLTEPRLALQRLCADLGIEFDERMLAWPAGRRDSDGVWARHWYAAVEKSTGFAPYLASTEPLPAHLEPVLAQCQPLYDQLYAFRTHT
jgi:hypothetical protein